MDHAAIEVVEIDPGVTEIARRQLGLPRDSRIASHHLDGRQFLKQSPAGQFDLVIQDAVNDLSVPYHLMTREYNELVSRSLKPDGVFLLTVIDSLRDGLFLRGAVRTMQASFREVRVLSPVDDWNSPQRRVFVIAGFGSPIALERGLDRTSQGDFHTMPAARLAELSSQDGPNGTIFTDDWAPVDFLMARTWLGPR